MSDDVDVISGIIEEQSREFLVADKRVRDDIAFVESGLEKVEFVRNKNYLYRLAQHVAQQEASITELKKQLKGKYSLIIFVDQESIKKENGHLKAEI